MRQQRWTDSNEGEEAPSWTRRTSSTDPSLYALGGSLPSLYPSYSPTDQHADYFHRPGGDERHDAMAYSTQSSPLYSSSRPPPYQPQPLFSPASYAYTNFPPPPPLSQQLSTFPSRLEPLHGAPPRSALPSRTTPHGHQHSSSFPPYPSQQVSQAHSEVVRDGKGRIPTRARTRSSRDNIIVGPSLPSPIDKGSRGWSELMHLPPSQSAPRPAVPWIASRLHYRSHSSMSPTWSPASPTFSNASTSTASREFEGEDDGPASPGSNAGFSLASPEEEQRLDSTFLAYITYLCNNSTLSPSTSSSARSSSFPSRCDDLDGRDHRATSHG